jgi:type I restriction-modification system DNA methylase subunit
VRSISYVVLFRCAPILNQAHPPLAFHFLKDEGVLAIILPHGVLFRGGAEERIRKKLLDDGHIRMQEERYSKRVPMERIIEEGNNLNCSRYISTAQQEVEIDLKENHKDLVRIQQKALDAARSHNKFLKELGLAPIPFGKTDPE